MQRSLACAGALVAASGLLVLGSGGPGDAAASRVIDQVATSPIEHVVIIYQENHSFDDVLGAVCEVRATPCNGYTGPVTFADGVTAPNIVMPDVVPVVAHDPIAVRLGLSDKWDRVVGCVMPPHYCVSHVAPEGIPNLAALANTFAVSDATFAAGHAASFGAHVTLGAGTFDGFAGYNPVNSITGRKPRPGWGCSSHLDALWGRGKDPSYQPSCIPDRRGDGPYRPSRVQYTPTIMERMEAAGRSWRIFLGTAHTPSSSPFSICTYFAWCASNRFTREWNSRYAAFYDEAQKGTLPDLSIVLPSGGNGQHNGLSMLAGDNYIGKVVAAVENGPNWDSTAIFITYDDCGCFYDHVTPPSKRMGLRNPMVIVSPWAKPQGTDSTTAVQPYSVLAFVEHVFGLQPLSREVSESYDYANSFDFSQRPLTGPPMTRRKIPLAERRQLARALPTVRQDPT